RAVQPLQRGHLLHARRAPRRPDVEQDDAAAQLPQRYGPPVQRAALERGRTRTRLERPEARALRPADRDEGRDRAEHEAQEQPVAGALAHTWDGAGLSFRSE